MTGKSGARAPCVWVVLTFFERWSHRGQGDIGDGPRIRPPRGKSLSLSFRGHDLAVGLEKASGGTAERIVS